MAEQPVPEIEVDRFCRMFAEISVHGATPAGGLDRMTATAADGAARDQLCRWLRDAGLEVRIDAVGNIFGLAVWNPGADFVLLGSHLDSQPNGGRFDGAYGVIAAAEIVIAMNEAVSQGLVAAPPLNLAVVNWTNEEGARFRPSLTGSSVYAGKLAPEDALALVDDDGISLGQALERIGYRGQDEAPRAVAAVEIHVEQGRVLEASGTDLAVVTGNWGANKYEVSFVGRQAHTGPTPMAERRDALLAAALLIARARGWSRERGEDVLYTSVGRAVIEPNSANVVPARVTLSLEVRSADVALLAEMDGVVRTALDEVCEDTACAVEILAESQRAPREFWPEGVTRAESAVAAAGLRCTRLQTVAGHDVVALMDEVPGVLLFVPSHAGIGHHEEEFTEEADLVRGCQAMAQLAWSLMQDAPESETTS